MKIRLDQSRPAGRPVDGAAWAPFLDERRPAEGLQAWIQRSIRRAIVEGPLAPGSTLPASRVLAAQLQVSRGTVTLVYEQLLAEGYLVARRGSGTVVNPKLPPDWRVPAGAAPRDAGATGAADFEPVTPLARSVTVRGTPFPLAAPPPEPLPLTPQLCDVRPFPIDLWRRLHNRHLRSSRIAWLGDAPAQGLPALRRAIAAHLSAARGVGVDAEQVVVVASVQQALDVAARLVLGPADSAWVEDPGYPGARRVLEATGARIADIPVDPDGLDVDRGIALAPRARLAVVTASRQAPLGVALAPPRRRRLLDWAAQAKAYLFEDDYDSEFRFNARPVPALKAIDRDDRVFLAGSFGKLMFPGLRLSYVIPPAALRPAFVAALSITARHPPAAVQAVLADFIDEGHLDRHVRRMRRLYAERAEALGDAARRHWQGLLQLQPVQAGLDVAAALTGGGRDADAARRLHAAGLGPRALRAYTSTQAMPPALVIGFATVDASRMDAVARQVARALAGSSPQRQRSH